eukprot:GHVQ01038684.1.p3 GENE.GHVQ01038684.1~~GHVQ01038684.1.p3  ORF type:complete len:175 (-),score=11.58 GHVQ01038684.1:1539-2063(-)
MSLRPSCCELSTQSPKCFGHIASFALVLLFFLWASTRTGRPYLMVYATNTRSTKRHAKASTRLENKIHKNRLPRKMSATNATNQDIHIEEDTDYFEKTYRRYGEQSPDSDYSYSHHDECPVVDVDNEAPETTFADIREQLAQLQQQVNSLKKKIDATSTKEAANTQIMTDDCTG